MGRPPRPRGAAAREGTHRFLSFGFFDLERPVPRGTPDFLQRLWGLRRTDTRDRLPRLPLGLPASKPRDQGGPGPVSTCRKLPAAAGSAERGPVPRDGAFITGSPAEPARTAAATCLAPLT